MGKKTGAAARTGLAVLLKGAALALALGAAGAAHAWPDRPVKMIVPFPAGGINDTVARLTGTYLDQELGTTVVIENRPGAGGTIATNTAINSDPDGYTILLGATSTMALAPNLYKSVKYVPERDLVALGGIAAVPSLAVVSSASPWKSLQELIDADKKNPEQITYGSAGAGTSHHIQTEMLKLRTGAKWLHIPYKGGAPAMTDLIGGQIDLLLEPLPTALQYVESGRIRPLGVTSMKRSPAQPDVPTFDELGIKDFEATLWFGLYAPKGTPDEAVTKLGQAIERVFARDDVKKDFAERGFVTYQGDREQFTKFSADEYKLWGDVIRQAGITLD